MSTDDRAVVSRQASGAQLRRLRVAAGLTQTVLAERAWISLRTLRNIELGRLTPHHATLVQIAKALGSTDVDAFIALWHARDDAVRSDDDLLATPIGFDQYLSPQARHARALQHIVSYATHAHIGPSGHLDRNHFTIAVRALAAGLDRTVHVAHDLQPLDWDRVRIAAPHNCHVLATRNLPNGTAKYFELGLGVTLQAQETALIGYEIDYTGARLPGQTAEPHRVIGVGARQPDTALTIQVEFHPAQRPAEIHYEHTLRADATPVLRRPLRLSPYGIAQIALTHAPTGLHSITWGP